MKFIGAGYAEGLQKVYIMSTIIKGSFKMPANPSQYICLLFFTGALSKEQDLSKFTVKLLYFLNIHS